jgi:hypothetical protein
MMDLALHRTLERHIAGLGLGDVGRRGPDQGRQDKSAASGRAHVVGWIGDFRHPGHLIWLAGAFVRNANDFIVPSAIPAIGERAPRHDDA